MTLPLGTDPDSLCEAGRLLAGRTRRSQGLPSVIADAPTIERVAAIFRLAGEKWEAEAS